MGFSRFFDKGKRRGFPHPFARCGKQGLFLWEIGKQIEVFLYNKLI
ncbi:hypothetical protein HMPREF0262_00348 [Clostridium sp. ATCC 29733]|nr:hypothetical protein HMPREF0262_00348 [Clostridium sp. ATCC 29733]